MEQMALSWRTLPGVSTSYNIVIAADNSAEKATKIISAEDYDRYKKLDRKYGKKSKKKKKKKKRSVNLDIDNPLIDSRDYAIMQSPATLKRQANEMSRDIEEGVKKFGDNNTAISYAFAKAEGKEKEFEEEKKKEADNIDYM